MASKVRRIAMADAVKVMDEHGLPDAKGLVATFARSLRDLDDYNFVAALVDRMEYFIDLHERQEEEEEGEGEEEAGEEAAQDDRDEKDPEDAEEIRIADEREAAAAGDAGEQPAEEEVPAPQVPKAEKPRPKPRRPGQTRTVADLLHEARG